MPKAKKNIKKMTRKFSKAAKKPKRTVKKSSPKGYSRNLNKKLDQVLSAEKSILAEEKSVEKKEEIIEKEEKNVEKEEHLLEKLEQHEENKGQREENELAKLEKLEQDIKQEVGSHPLAKITFKDVVKGLVGAFVGLAVHYTFTYGVEISQRIDITRITLLYVVSFFIGLLFIYATGFRKIKDPKILMFMPVRLMVLYVTAIFMSIVVLFIFYPTFGHDLVESYKMVGGVLLAAIIGSCTADLIGKE